MRCRCKSQANHFTKFSTWCDSAWVYQNPVRYERDTLKTFSIRPETVLLPSKLIKCRAYIGVVHNGKSCPSQFYNKLHTTKRKRANYYNNDFSIPINFLFAFTSRKIQSCHLSYAAIVVAHIQIIKYFETSNHISSYSNHENSF